MVFRSEVEADLTEATRHIAPDTADLATADLVTAVAVLTDLVTEDAVLTDLVTEEAVTTGRILEHPIAPAAATIDHRTGDRIRQRSIGARLTAVTPLVGRIAGRADFRVAAAVLARRATIARRLRRIAARIRAEDAVQRQLCGTLSLDSVQVNRHRAQVQTVQNKWVAGAMVTDDHRTRDVYWGGA